MSSAETAFELIMLDRFDVELLLGQINYSQKAEIYNTINGYPVPFKQCTTIKKEELPVRPRFVYTQHDTQTFTLLVLMYFYPTEAIYQSKGVDGS